MPMFDGLVRQLKRLVEVEIQHLACDRDIRDQLKKLVLLANAAVGQSQQQTTALTAVANELRVLSKTEQVNGLTLIQMQQILADIKDELKQPPQPSVSLEISWFDANGKPIFRESGMPLQMTDVQSVSATVAEADAAGNPVTLDVSANTVTWGVSDPTILSFTQNPDGSCAFKALGKLGDCQVSVTVAPNDGSQALNAQDTITIVASAATTLNVQFGTPA